MLFNLSICNTTTGSAISASISQQQDQQVSSFSLSLECRAPNTPTLLLLRPRRCFEWLCVILYKRETVGPETPDDTQPATRGLLTLDEAARSSFANND